MKIQTIPFAAGIVAVVLTSAVAGAATLSAAAGSDSPVALQELQSGGMNTASEASLLTQSYVILSHGDHDYKGHRVKAMHAIEEAAKLLNVKLVGDGKGHEQQGLSDVQLRSAKSMLEEVSNRPAIKKEKKVVKHVDTAISEIDLALTIH